MSAVIAILSGEMKLRGTWLDLSGQFRAAQRGESTSTRKFVKKHTLELDKLPCWKHLDDEDYRKHVRALVDVITEETAMMHELHDARAGGLRAPRRQRAQEAPAYPVCSPTRPLAKASRPRGES